MKSRRIVPLTMMALLAAGVVAGAANAESRDGTQDKRDAAALATLKITLTQAIATAEQQIGGRAVGADVSQDRGATRIAVEVAGPQGVKTVLVDGQTGQVTATRDGGQDDDDTN